MRTRDLGPCAGVRCVRHRCVAAAPLPIPLPFPQLFAPTVLRFGDVVCGGGSDQGSHNGSDPGQGPERPPEGTAPAEVESVPVLSRVFATAAATDFARRQLQVFRGAVLYVMNY